MNDKAPTEKRRRRRSGCLRVPTEPMCEHIDMVTSLLLCLRMWKETDLFKKLSSPETTQLRNLMLLFTDLLHRILEHINVFLIEKAIFPL